MTEQSLLGLLLEPDGLTQPVVELLAVRAQLVAGLVVDVCPHRQLGEVTRLGSLDEQRVDGVDQQPDRPGGQPTSDRAAASSGCSAWMRGSNWIGGTAPKGESAFELSPVVDSPADESEGCSVGRPV